MGYYTKFRLSIEQGQADLGLVYDKLNKIVMGDESGSPFYYEDGNDDISSDDVMKWYDHDDDCAELSKTFPGVTFCLAGEGEENGDMWKTYYRNGFCQICRAVTTYPPFDASKLNTVDEAHRRDGGR